ncbi:hypothetical protein Nmel_014775, partial [Mimus melanotis]
RTASPPAPARTGRVSGRCRLWVWFCLCCSRSFFRPPLLGRRGPRGRAPFSPERGPFAGGAEADGEGAAPRPLADLRFRFRVRGV